MTTDLEFDLDMEDPLEEVEQYLAQEQLHFERVGPLEVQFSVTGTWCDYPMWFRWLPQNNILQTGLGIEAKVPENRAGEVADLIVQINERLVIGHFDIWSSDRTVVYRHGQLFEQGQVIREAMVQQYCAAAIQAAEILTPALNFLLWSDKTPTQAVEAAMFETIGEA